MKQAEAKRRAPETLPAISEDGVDLTLIRWMLSLTVEERLRLLEDHAAFVWELRHANRSRGSMPAQQTSDCPLGVAG